MITFIVQLCYQVCTKCVYCGLWLDCNHYDLLVWQHIRTWTWICYYDGSKSGSCHNAVGWRNVLFLFQHHQPDLLQGFLGWIWRQWAKAWRDAFKCMIYSTMSGAELKQQQNKAAILDCTNSTLLLLTNYLKYPREMWKIWYNLQFCINNFTLNIIINWRLQLKHYRIINVGG